MTSKLLQGNGKKSKNAGEPAAKGQAPISVIIPKDNEGVTPRRLGGKAPDPTSDRQRILQILANSGPLTPKEITEQLATQFGVTNKVYVSSHLYSFKEKDQVIHNEDGTYEASDEIKTKYAVKKPVKSGSKKK
jgi:hypothetical protein